MFENKNILICVLTNVIYNFICNETFPCFEGHIVVPSSFNYPLIFARIFCHLLRICVELFTLPNFVLSLPVKATISSIPFTAAILIRRSVLCTLRVTFLLPVISATIITYIIRQYHCQIHSAPSALLRFNP